MTKAVSATVVLAVACALGLGCGSGNEERVPDESQDMLIATGGSQGPTIEGTQSVGPDIDGTQWKWVEATCTEGPLELGEKGFVQQARVKADPQGLLISYDQAFPQQACVQTVMQRWVPGQSRDAPWTMKEVAHVALPPECGIAPEQDRPGHVRKRGELLEVFVQRSNWCDGLEVRMVYAPARPAPLAGDQIVRHYAGHFNRQDALRVSGLFAQSGSLVEPFTESRTGSTRHEGASSVHAWHAQAFAGVPWLALRLTSMTEGDEEGQWTAEWEYMDPRLSEPFPGRTHFTVAGGEVFEARFELTGEPREGEPPPLSPQGEPSGDGKGQQAPADPEPGEGGA
ncbi:MAG: hypothetical protein ACOCUS_04900, partial [Polyangiales bacterium]